MKIILSLCVALAVASTSGDESNAAQTTNTIHLATITLPDQHDREHKLVLPQPRAFVVTVADRKGSEQIEPWVHPLKERYGEKLLVEGVADVSSVPKLLRAMIRSRFKEKSAHPIMLDWEGETVRKFNPKADTANIFIVATNGAVIFSQHGAADTNKLEQAYKVLDEQLPRTDPTNSATLKNWRTP